MGIIRDIVKSFKDHDCLTLAANISFFAVLSLVPFLMIIVSVAGFVLGSSQELFQQVISTITDVLPAGETQLYSHLNNLVYGKSKMGGIGVVFLLFTASFLFSSIEHAFNIIFHSVKRRNFFHSRLLAVLLVFGVISVLFLPTIVSLFQSILMRFNIDVPLGDLATSKWFFAVTMAVSFIAGIMIIPTQRAQFKFALIGGVFFSLAVAVVKYLFKLYISFSFHRYSLIYGSLSVLIVSLIWIYYLSNILLLASELVAVLQRRYSKWQNEASGNHA